jgi:hypothetical protein
MFKELFTESKNEVTLLHTDNSKNKNYVVIDKSSGKILRSYNQNDISTSISNIVFNVGDLRTKGYENTGYKHQAQYAKDSAKEAVKYGKNNDKKIAQKFSELLNIKFKVA